MDTSKYEWNGFFIFASPLLFRLLFAFLFQLLLLLLLEVYKCTVYTNYFDHISHDTNTLK